MAWDHFSSQFLLEMGTKVLCWSGYCSNYTRISARLVLWPLVHHMHRINWSNCDALWLFLSEVVENVLQVGKLARNGGEKVWRSRGRDIPIQESATCGLQFCVWC